MKKNKDMLRGFVLGVLLTAMIAAVPAVGAAATKRTIDVIYNDIKLVIDGKEVTPLDANGNVVEPFAYNGTTYLPLRACVNAITGGTKPVDWDQETFTIYIGERPVEANKVVDLTAFKAYPYGVIDVFKAGGDAFSTFKVRQQEISAFNYLSVPGTILLNGDYTTFNAIVAMPDDSRDQEGTAKFTNADTGEELFSITVKKGEEPVPISFDVTGVDKMAIDSWTILTKLYNATLTTISRD